METDGGVEPLDRPMTDADALDSSPPERSRTDAAALRSWARVVGGAVLFAIALRVLAFEAYRIPSTSMEDTLLVGDFVLVSKLHYGPRVMGRRLPGVGRPTRGDVVVFNYPPNLDSSIARRTPYIKRVVGLPGDTLTIESKMVRLGDEAFREPRRGRSMWEIRGRLPTGGVLDTLGLARRVQRVRSGLWVVSATETQAEALAEVDGVDGVVPYVRPAGDGSASFPAARRYSLDDYGPVVVPKQGASVRLDDASWPLVRTAIERFEGRRTERTADGFLIDGRPAETYTFGQDYYFVLGDSRDDSADSRTWGFVPFDHVIGKALVVYFSWDEAEGAPRWRRIGSDMQ